MVDANNGLYDIDSFLDPSLALSPIIDVRSPSEFKHGHMPGSFSLPLFSDEERAIIGTLYKKNGKLDALLRGLEYVGPKMASLAHTLLDTAQRAGSLTIRLLCWRGGMRSESMAWLASRIGLTCIRLKGGYKAYRRYVIRAVNEERPCIIIGGYTGSGKTSFLQEYARSIPYPILNLEELAGHRGSAFGHFPETVFVSQEQFENEIALHLCRIPSNLPFIVEDESRMIGSNVIPEGLWSSMQKSPLFYLLLVKREDRLKRIVKEYGEKPTEWLISCIEKLQKKRGSQKTADDIEHVRRGEKMVCASSLIDYYDRAYSKSLQSRRIKRGEALSIIECSSVSELLNMLTVPYEGLKLL